MNLIVKNINFSYSTKPVLKGVSFVLNETEIMCVVGPNGSGKSTLIKCIEGLLNYKEGSVFLSNVDIKSMNQREIAKQIAYVPQSTRQLFSSTVFDTILMGRNPYYSWKKSDKDVEIVIDVISKMGLENIALQDFNQLSGGQQQRVLIARAIAQQPKILLLDEPTSALDISHQLEVMEIIHSLAHSQKMQVLIIVHDLNLAARYANKILMLKDGKVFALGGPNEVLTTKNIEEVYGVKSSINLCEGSLSVIPIKRINKKNKIDNYSFG